MKKIYFVSSNPGKREELRSLLDTYLQSIGFNLEFTDLDVPEIQASGDEIIRDKLRLCAQRLSSILICEDSALCFKAWNWLPGVYM